MSFWDIWAVVFSFPNFGFCLFLLCVTRLVWQVTPATFHTRENLGGITFAKASILQNTSPKSLGTKGKPIVKKELHNINEIVVSSVGMTVWALLLMVMAALYASIPALLYEWLIVDVIFGQIFDIRFPFNYETAIFAGAFLSLIYWYALELSACASCLTKTREGETPPSRL